MSSADVIALLPLLILLGTVILVLFLGSLSRSHGPIVCVTGLGLVAAFVALVLVPRRNHVALLLSLDSYSAFYVGLIMAAAFAVTLLSYDYLKGARERPDNYYALLLVATIGSAILASSVHFASFFLGLEILSVSLYPLIAYQHASRKGSEAAIKYLILAGTSSSFLLFGMALIYGSSGTMEFNRIAPALAANATTDPLAVTGTALLLVGIGFKLALVPFHLWTPDAYEGAPAPVTAFIATVSKGAVFALLARYIPAKPAPLAVSLTEILAIVAFLSMTAGNLLALRQGNVKRLLAYSSIAHLGYLLVALIAGIPLGRGAIAFYLLSYFVTTLLAFGTVSVLSTAKQDADRPRDYLGLFWRRPLLAAIFTASLLSLAGIPLTAGFIGKYYLVLSGVGAALWTLVVILVINSVIALYYYLRVVVMMFTEPVAAPESAHDPSTRGLHDLHDLHDLHETMPSGVACLVTLTALLLWLGIYPSPFLSLTQATVTSLIR